MLTAEKITVRYGEHTAVDQVSLSLEEGQWLMLAGPNGAGKSSLLGALAQGIPYEGRVTLAGRDLKTLSSRERAREVGVLQQRHQVAYAYTVEEIVTLGRYAHRQGFLAGKDISDRDAVERALTETGMMAFRNRSMLELSGGEVQRAFLAQVFAQDPKILLLDEPANHLDLPYQKQIYELIQQWGTRPGRAVISVVHDLSAAMRFGTHCLLMRAGKAAATGPVRDVLTPEKLEQVYEMDVYGWMTDLLKRWGGG